MNESFTWNLTPTERRIAEAVFAAAFQRWLTTSANVIDHRRALDLATTTAVHAVLALREIDGACLDMHSTAMLKELRG